MNHPSRSLVLVLLLACSFSASAQERIDGTFSFQTDPAKAYSIYVPSGYVDGEPHRLMVGMHPLNPSRWDAGSWCDTLTAFAEENGLLLVCPDGGADGAVDDPIDTAFTTALLDSMYQWYSVDHDKVYIMGFSWGGLTTYTYGLLRPAVFKGYLPIGAAITDLNEVDATMQANSVGKPVYIVHGGSDSPNTRYTPIRNALISSGAIVNSILMPGVGHTIDFPDRNAILGTAFQWIDSVNCADLTTGVIESFRTDVLLQVVPSVLDAGESAELRISAPMQGELHIRIFDDQGRMVHGTEFRATRSQLSIQLPLPVLPAGTYIVQVNGAGSLTQRILVR